MDNCNTTCSPEDFKCDNGECTSLLWRCDGDNDCSDRSDESKEMCAHLACPPGKFRCSNFLCIPQTEVCNNYNDCDDGSDEDPAVCQVSVSNNVSDSDVHDVDGAGERLVLIQRKVGTMWKSNFQTPNPTERAHFDVRRL